MKKNQNILRFDPKIEAKLLDYLSDLLSPATSPISENELIRRKIPVLDSANVIMIQGKSEPALRVLSRFIESDSDQKTPEIDYENQMGACIGKYSWDYLIKAVGVLNLVENDSVTITMRKDYPLCLENVHFLIVIAPRVNESDKK